MTHFPVEQLIPLCRDFSVEINETQISQLNIYGNLLLEWNEKINLTAITDPKDIVFKHFFDCILFLKYVTVRENAKIIDVGTGAGFPGIVLKIMRPDIDLSLLDGLNKRLVFLADVLEKIGFAAKIVHMRAEQAGKNAGFREKFDISCARAVAKQNILCEYCIPFVKSGGVFVAMKGSAAQAEAGAAERAANLLGGSKPDIFHENLPTGEERCFILTKKISQTPPKYPRISAKISKQPL